MVVDICTYNGEKDLWDIHYNVLKDYVDEFIVVEFDRTFSGQIKAPSFPVAQYPEVRYHFIGEEFYEKYRELSESSPQTAGADHWKREFMQKESIKDCLTHLQDDDVVIVGDVDEIWNPIARLLQGVYKLKLEVYAYYLNNRSTEEFYGPLVAKYRDIRDSCLNHLRMNAQKTRWEYGLHFTSMGGPEALKKKLTDSYTQESYATPTILENVAYNIANGKDFLGRDFKYTLDESAWPEYLKQNKEKYAHLLATT